MKNYNFPIIIEQDEHGYFASCPELQGCYTQGESYEEALNNIKDAIELHVKDRLTIGEPVSIVKSVSLSTVEVAA